MKRKSFSVLLLTASLLIMSACGGEQPGQQAEVQVPATPEPPTPVPAAPTPEAAAAPAAPAPQPAAAPAASTPQAVAKAAEPEEPAPPLAVPPGYRYEPRGRRDPFINPVPQPAPTETGPPVVRPDGLPGVLVAEVKIAGIVHSGEAEMNRAMLTAGRRTYFAEVGDSLFDAIIKEIRPDEVVFTMVSTTTREPANRETVMAAGGTLGEKR